MAVNLKEINELFLNNQFRFVNKFELIVQNTQNRVLEGFRESVMIVFINIRHHRQSEQ